MTTIRGRPFGAGNAANLIAGAQIYDARPRFFRRLRPRPRLYRRAGVLDRFERQHRRSARSSPRMLNLTGASGRDAMPTFTASNFTFTTERSRPCQQPSTLLLLGTGHCSRPGAAPALGGGNDRAIVESFKRICRVGSTRRRVALIMVLDFNASAGFLRIVADVPDCHARRSVRRCRSRRISRKSSSVNDALPEFPEGRFAFPGAPRGEQRSGRHARQSRRRTSDSSSKSFRVRRRDRPRSRRALRGLRRARRRTRSSRSTACRSRSRRANASPSSARTAPANRRR